MDTISTPNSTTPMGGYPSGNRDVNIDSTTVVTPTDRVRWGAILAGLVTALAALAVLGTLGSAVGASAYDPGDSARNFGIGAGIWGIISVLIAFMLGGCIAARTAAVRGRNNGMMNGAMVWAVAIPLMAYVVAGLLGKAVSTGAEAADAIRSVTVDQTQMDGSSETQPVSTRMENATQDIDSEQVADRTARSAWTTLVGLLLSLGAATVGGYMGARHSDSEHEVRTSHA